jgi:hypothetical protein
MHQSRNEPVPDEGVDVPKVRPQGAMCTILCHRSQPCGFIQLLQSCVRHRAPSVLFPSPQNSMALAANLARGPGSKSVIMSLSFTNGSWRSGRSPSYTTATVIYVPHSPSCSFENCWEHWLIIRVAWLLAHALLLLPVSCSGMIRRSRAGSTMTGAMRLIGSRYSKKSLRH